MKKYYLLLIAIVTISCKNKDENNTKEKIGNNIKNGKYRFYKKNKQLYKTLEYINLCGEQYLNQGWYFNKNLDTLYENSNYYKVSVEKNILKPNEKSRITLSYKPLMKNSVSVLLLGDKNIDDNFCNLKEMKLDTLYFVDNKLEFYQCFKSKGIKKLGGYIFEIKKLKNKVNNHSVYDERKVYIKIIFEVK
ncbi:hypothetical protein V8245_07565 [Flavobacterium columnare]|uniref:hypothetical protein n=1 Tax=Flavobacterium columnare TaxID=996 RepID=UPI003C308CBB